MCAGWRTRSAGSDLRFTGTPGAVPMRWPAPHCCPSGSTRCAVGAGSAPSHAEGVDFFGRLDPGRGQTFRLALEGEEKLRPFLAEGAASIMAKIAAGSPEMLPEPGEPTPPGRTSYQPGRLARSGALDGGGPPGQSAGHPRTSRPPFVRTLAALAVADEVLTVQGQQVTLPMGEKHGDEPRVRASPRSWLAGRASRSR